MICGAVPSVRGKDDTNKSRRVEKWIEIAGIMPSSAGRCSTRCRSFAYLVRRACSGALEYNLRQAPDTSSCTYVAAAKDLVRWRLVSKDPHSASAVLTSALNPVLPLVLPHDIGDPRRYCGRRTHIQRYTHPDRLLGSGNYEIRQMGKCGDDGTRARNAEIRLRNASPAQSVLSGSNVLSVPGISGTRLSVEFGGVPAAGQSVRLAALRLG